MNKRMNSCLAIVIALGIVGAGVACGEPEAETPTVAKKEAAPKDDLPAENPDKAAAEAYTYNATNRRDPFKTYFDELGQVETTNTANLTELQKIDLDKLKLVAVVVGTATPMALVEDPTGKGHTIKIGTLVGKRLGQVKQIRRGEVVVQEEFRDFTGKRIPQIKEIKLQDDSNAQATPAQ